MGLTRIDVLVVVLIVVLLGGLVVAWIARVREAAACTGCRNNLRQLSLAVHSYADAWNRLPPLTDQGKGALTGSGVPSLFAILPPYMEAVSRWYDPKRSTLADYHAHSSIVFTYTHKGFTLTAHGGLVNQAYRPFLDPGDATGDKLRDVAMILPDGTMGYYATGSYAANGLLRWGVGSIYDLIPRGPANVILFAEKPQVCRAASGEVTYNLWGLGFYSPHMPAFAALTPTEPPGQLSTGQIAPALPLPMDDAPDRDAAIRVKTGRQDAAAQPPDFDTPLQLLRGNTCDPRLPGSPHRAGMQMAMADGSMRVFTRDTSPWVFWTACAPDVADDP
jgi:hypothetical protein